MGAPSTDNSFIPKRNPASRPRRAASQQVYLLMLLSYVLFFATLVASIGVFLYDRYVDSQLEKEVLALNTEINRFQESDMNEVRTFDRRLTQARSRVQHLASLPSLFTALENATAQTVRIKSLLLTREDDQGFILTAAVETDNFDSSIFQREVLERNSTLQSATIESLDVGSQDADGEVLSANNAVTFTAVIGVPLSTIARSAQSANPPVPIAPVVENEEPINDLEPVEAINIEPGFEQHSLEDLPVTASEESL